MKEHLHTSFHAIRGFAASGASGVREQRILTLIYDEAGKALARDREEMRGAANGRKELSARISNYLGNGGLFNPELMEHDKVQRLLMDCQSYFDKVDS